MNPKGRIVVFLLILITGAAGALGMALFKSDLFRVKHFTIDSTQDSLRIRPLIELLQTYQGSYFFQISSRQLRNDISDFKQVERVTIKRVNFNEFNISIELRRPVLMVTNGQERICLGPEAIPFPYWSEYGHLPVFEVPETIAVAQLSNPDPIISDFYQVILHIVSQPLDTLKDFSQLVKYSKFEIQLADQQHGQLLRLPRNRYRDPVSSLIKIHKHLLTLHQPYQNLELDFRFSDILILRPISKEASYV